MTATALTASRIVAALSHRTWAMDGVSRCHLFLLLGGRAVLLGSDLEIMAPTMLWLPHGVRDRLQVMAGGEGFGASASVGFVQRTVGDPALTVHLRPLLDRMALAGPAMLAPCLAASTNAFATLTDEAEAARPAGAAMASRNFAMLLLLLRRCIEMPTERRSAGATTVQRFRQLVELHYREGLRIDAFASRLGVTRAHLHDACLRATGRTPLALLHERLLAEARARLEQTDLSVEQVGYGIGFRDPGYSNRFFRRLSGQSHGAYRRSFAGGARQRRFPRSPRRPELGLGHREI